MSKALFIGLIVLIFFSCKNEKVILAEIDGIVVDKTEFLKRLKEARKQMSLPDNGEVRRGVLTKLINEKLFIVEAKMNNFDSDKQGLMEYERLEIQELLNTYTMKEILANVSINEKMLQDFYIRTETKIKARHLYAASKKEADSLYYLLSEGATFEQLATSVFNDPYLRNKGGDLGFIAYNDMEHSFADTAFSLKVGEISRPVKINNGYSIIRVDDKISNPLTTETEYLKKRSKILPELTKREQKKAVKRHADSLANNLEIKINQNVFDNFFTKIKKNKLANRSQEDVFIPSDIGEPENEILADSRIGTFSIGEFKRLARFSSEGQRNWIKNKENLQDFINGLIVRKHLLKIAEQKGLADEDEFKSKVNWKFDSFLIDRVTQTIKNNIHISADSSLQYYNKNQNKFTSPAMINLREIVVLEKKQAGSIHEKLKNGKPFINLVKKFSIGKSASFDGETGFVTSVQLDKLADHLFSLQPNQWRGPIVMNNSYVFLQCIEKKTADIIPYADVKNDIQEILKRDIFETVIIEKLSEIKSHIKMTSYPAKLREISYN